MKKVGLPVQHLPVLLGETLRWLNVKKRGFYLDATLGGGGLSRAILDQGGHVLGLDRDQSVLAVTRERMTGTPDFRAVYGNFKDLERIAVAEGYAAGFDGIVFDLGLSSFQLETPGRGFSYRRDEPLDMRSDAALEVTAADVIKGFSKKDLYEIFVRFGEERISSRLVDIIEERRGLKPIETTGDLYRLIREVSGRGTVAAKVAPRIFQALRIVINDEVANLKLALPRAFGILKIGGRLLVIGYHSLEDRLVKRFFLERQKTGQARVLTPRPVVPSREEVRVNPSARSAKLRGLEKCHD